MIGQPRPPSKPTEVPALFIQVTKPELDILIGNSQLEIGQFYKVMGVDDDFCNVFLTAISNNQLERKGVGEFLVPDYNSYSVYKPLMSGQLTNIVGQFFADELLSSDVLGASGIYRSNSIIQCIIGDWGAATQITGLQSGATANILGFVTPNYPLGMIVIRDGKHYQSLGNPFYNDPNGSSNLDLDSNFVPTNEGMIINFDIIEYNYQANKIEYRKDKHNNEYTDNNSNEGGGYGYIKRFRWNDSLVTNNVVKSGYMDILNAYTYFQFSDNKCENWFVFIDYVIDAYIVGNNAIGLSFSNNRGSNYDISENRGTFAIQNNFTNNFKFSKNNTGECFASNNGGNNYVIENNTSEELNLQQNNGNNYTVTNNVVNKIDVLGNTGNDFKLDKNTGNTYAINYNTGQYYYYEENTVLLIAVQFNTMSFCFFTNNTGKILSLNEQVFTNKNIQKTNFENGVIDVLLSAATFFFQNYDKKVFSSNDGTTIISYFDSLTNAEVYNLVEA